jgi:hypothetical protein
MFQLKEGLQNNHLRLKMTKMITREEDYLLSKTRRMSHQVEVLRSSQKMKDNKKTPQKGQRRQVL